jgi:hypothetical protein
MVIRRQDQKHGVGLLAAQGGHGDGRRGVAPGRFEHDFPGKAQASELLGHDEPVLDVADGHGRAGPGKSGHPGERLLEQGLFAHKRQKLFRVQVAGERPEAASAAAAQNDGLYHGISRAISFRPAQGCGFPGSWRA